MSWSYDNKVESTLNVSEEKLDAAAKKENEEAYQAFLRKQPRLTHEEESELLLEEIRAYGLGLSTQDAEDIFEFCIYKAEAENFLPRLLTWLKENQLDKETDIRMQAAAVEYGKNIFSY